MKFSIIIPCYNTCKCVKKCIESILCQTYSDWEMLLVNDGSTDHTLNILYAYAERDMRIRVIDQENRGVSAARNKAIMEANGDYLVFLDSDDWYRDEKCLQRIIESLKNGEIDIVVFRYQRVQDGNSNHSADGLQYFKEMVGDVYTGEEYLQEVLSRNGIYMWYLGLYVFKRDLWIKNQFQFDTTLRLLEDMDILYQVILKAQKIKVLNYIIYQYRIRQDSAIHTNSKEAMEAQLSVCRNNIMAVNSMVISKDLKKLLSNNFSYIYFMMLTEVNELNNPDDRKAMFKQLEKNRDLMNYAMRRKNKMIKKVAYIFGLPVISKILFIRQKYKSSLTRRFHE